MQGEESAGPAEGDSLPLMDMGPGETEASEQWDCVLVADRSQSSPGRARRRRRFLERLERKGFQVKAMEDQEKLFFGIRANSGVFSLYRTLLREPGEPTPTVQPTTRIRIVNFVLNKETAEGDTLEDLVKDGVFEISFPLHEEERRLKEWAQWRSIFRRQPIDSIRDYFGEKVALYFAWLGWYTAMLAPAAAVGLVIFLSGFSLFHASQISKEICEAHDVLLCPRGDHGRRFQRLSDTCTFAKLTHLFDNDGTVLFAAFMAVWATVFLEIWKRKRAEVVLHWDLYGWDEDQEEMALELINCPEYKLQPQRHSYLRSAAILVLSLLMICLMIGMAHLLVVYRVLAAAFFRTPALPFLEEQINKYVAQKLCDLAEDLLRAREPIHHQVLHSAILCPFLLPHLHRLHPGQDQRSPWEVCAPGGFVEAGGVPPQRLHDGPVRADGHHHGPQADAQQLRGVPGPVSAPCPAPAGRIQGREDPPPRPSARSPEPLPHAALVAPRWLALKLRVWRQRRTCPDPELRGWKRNYLLNPVNVFSLFDEFMEMMIQYGFTTIFVAAFPLAPLLALFSNLVEIRLDAIKMVRLQRRLVPRKAKDIGTWLQVLEAIGVLAVIANGLVIAFTSEFIPRLVYKYRYGPCGQGARATVDCLTGYVNHSLSVFHTKDFRDPVQMGGSENVTQCRYRDYRNAHDYRFSEQFWFLLAIRLAFVILFEHVALCSKLIAAWFVPDVPQSVKNKVLEEKYCRLLEKMCSSPRTTDV
ncbi:anoctamin-9 isoform X2 [Dasypus novemcinctus]|uniref:anoctamin-9 isoform X2 n=1 Tax=Dasypus novemcinctus TaxID=9361 RepID=UPI00265E4C30|nr:anoctamin-9 isoform X2 [Dasypus novemcinctus]